MSNRLLLGALLFTLATAALFLYVICRLPEPSGVDGYFYLKQIKSLASEGVFYFQDRSLAFILPTFLAKLGFSPLNAFRIAQTLTWITLLVVMSLWSANISFENNDSPVARTYSCLLTFAAALVFLPFIELALEFYKTLFALVLFSGGTLLLFGWRKHKRLCPLTGSLLIVMALLTHKSVFLFLGIGGAVWLIGNFSMRRLAIVFSGIVVLTGMFLCFYPQAGAYIVALFSFFQSPVQWLEWITYIFFNSPDRVGIYLLVAGYIVLWVKLRSSIAPTQQFLFDTIAITALFVLHPFQVHSPDGPAYRILLMLPALILPFVIGVLLQQQKYRTSTAVLLSLVFVSFLFAWKQPLRHFYNWPQFEQGVQVITEHVQPENYLIAHHGLEFYVDYITGIRARQYVNSDNEKSVYRIVYIPPNRPDGEARIALEEVQLVAIGNDYGLFREGDWQQLSKLFNIHPHWKNPVEKKPAHIY